MNILSVPVIPTGLSGDPANPSTGGVIITVLILFLFIAWIIYHSRARKRHKKPEILGRYRDDYGRSPLDFEHQCCFKEQIEKIGEGTKDGSGEEVKVKMESGKTAIFQLFSERFNYTGDYTGQRNWRYHFVRYL